MKDLLLFLEGKKTYLMAILLIVIEVLRFYGILSHEVANSLEVFVGAGGLAALRGGVSRMNQ